MGKEDLFKKLKIVWAGNEGTEGTFCIIEPKDKNRAIVKCDSVVATIKEEDGKPILMKAKDVEFEVILKPNNKVDILFRKGEGAIPAIDKVMEELEKFIKNRLKSEE